MRVSEVTVEDVLQVVDGFAPFAAAADWDRVGLLVGDAAAPVERVFVARDPLVSTLTAARAKGADLVLTHHPLFLEPPGALVVGDPVAERVMVAVRERLSVAAAHTNADLVPSLATGEVVEALGLQGAAPLVPMAPTSRLKVVVFVPPAAVEDVSQAMAEAGAGLIGRYAECGFRSCGEGTFRPLPGAHPSVGTVGELERVEEVRLEMVVDGPRLGPVLAAMKEAHPYEEVAHDVYALECGSFAGLGCVGRLGEPLSFSELVERLVSVYGLLPRKLPAGDVVGGGAAGADGRGAIGAPQAGRRVECVAILPGSAGGAAPHAVRQGADVLVCGEMKYHEALDAAEQGLVVLALGHAASDRPLVRALARALREAFGERGMPVAVIEESSAGEGAIDPA